MGLEHIADSINKIVDRDINIRNKQIGERKNLKRWAAQSGVSWDDTWDDMSNDDLTTIIGENMQLRSEEDYYYKNNFTIPEPEKYKNLNTSDKINYLRMYAGSAKELKGVRDSITELGVSVPEIYINDIDKLRQYRKAVFDFRSGIYSSEYENFQNEIMDSEAGKVVEYLKMNDENNIFNNYFNEKFKNEKYPNAAFIKSLYKDGQSNVESIVQEHISWAGSKGMTIHNNMVDNLRSQLTKNQNPVQIWENQKKNIENKQNEENKRKILKIKTQNTYNKFDDKNFEKIYNSNGNINDYFSLFEGQGITLTNKEKEEINNKYNLFKQGRNYEEAGKAINIIKNNPSLQIQLLKELKEGKIKTPQDVYDAINSDRALNLSTDIGILNKDIDVEKDNVTFGNTKIDKYNSNIQDLNDKIQWYNENGDIQEWVENEEGLSYEQIQNPEFLAANPGYMDAIERIISNRQNNIKMINTQIENYRKLIDDAQQDERLQYTQSEKIKNKTEKEKAKKDAERKRIELKNYEKLNKAINDYNQALKLFELSKTKKDKQSEIKQKEDKMYEKAIALKILIEKPENKNYITKNQEFYKILKKMLGENIEDESTETQKKPTKPLDLDKYRE